MSASGGRVHGSILRTPSARPIVSSRLARLGISRYDRGSSFLALAAVGIHNLFSPALHSFLLLLIATPLPPSVIKYHLIPVTLFRTHSYILRHRHLLQDLQKPNTSTHYFHSEIIQNNFHHAFQLLRCQHLGLRQLRRCSNFRL